MGSLVGETFSYEWSQSGDNKSILLEATIHGVHITVMEVEDSAMTEDDPYEVIELIDDKRLGIMIIVSKGYVQFIEDEVGSIKEAATTLGAFFGHICTEAANNLLNHDPEDE